MMMQRNKVLGNSPRLTQSAYRQAVSETVRAVADDMTDQDMADAWGVSAATVGNARNRNSDLSALPLLKLGERFGYDALSTVLALIGAKAVPVDAICALDVGSIPINVAKALPLLMKVLADNELCDVDVRELEDEGVIDYFGQFADMLRQRRDALRLRAVS